MARESLYSKMPDYRVDLVPHDARVRVFFEGVLLADSTRALRVEETKHEPVLYFPREDVAFDQLEESPHESFCPFKGEASYWSVRTAEGSADDVVWSYEDPFPEVAGLKDYVAFWFGKAKALRLDESPGSVS